MSRLSDSQSVFRYCNVRSRASYRTCNVRTSSPATIESSLGRTAVYRCLEKRSRTPAAAASPSGVRANTGRFWQIVECAVDRPCVRPGPCSRPPSCPCRSTVGGRDLAKLLLHGPRGSRPGGPPGRARRFEAGLSPLRGADDGRARRPVRGGRSRRPILPDGPRPRRTPGCGPVPLGCASPAAGSPPARGPWPAFTDHHHTGPSRPRRHGLHVRRARSGSCAPGFSPTTGRLVGRRALRPRAALGCRDGGAS